MQQPIEQNLGDDHEDAGVGVDAAIAGDEADVVFTKAPADGPRPSSRSVWSPTGTAATLTSPR